MAIKKACSTNISLGNTGKECDSAMGATAMLIAVPPNLKFTDSDLADPLAWIEPLMHANGRNRVYPFFGRQAPIRTINNNNESDVIATMDDGTQIFVRYGVYNRSYETTSGGLCYAKALRGLNKSGFSIIEIDQDGQMLVRKNSDGTYSGLACSFMYSPSPSLADFKNPYKNKFQYSMDPGELVNNGEIFEGAQELLSLIGLIDTNLVLFGAASATKIPFDVVTDCAEASLIAQFGTLLAVPANFVVTDLATGLPVAITAAAVVGGNHIELTGTFTSGKKYSVVGANPSVWFTATVEGYDASGSTLVVTIP